VGKRAVAGALPAADNWRDMSGQWDTPQGPPMDGLNRLGRDPLTGLQNEHLFRAQFPEEFALARTRETNGALLAVKLDNILEINRTHGRTGGDEALRALAYVIANYRGAEGRESHVVFKVGGPILGYYIPQCTDVQARQVAEDLHRLVIDSEQYIERLTVSIGVANLYEFFLEEGTREELALRVLQAAFYRLSLAEQQGTNTICDSSAVGAETTATRPRVLLVEPEAQSMLLLVRALEAADLTVDVREDGEGAMAYIQATPPALIICEALAPRISGFTIRERLRTNALWNAIPFILVSHKKSEDLIRKAVENDIRHFFQKPISLLEVVGLVTNITRKTSR
jgi:diguanylate cyclase (GGDEF)-like protein